MTPPDYVFHSFLRVGRRGGGIAVLMSKSLAPKVTFRCLSYASLEAVTMCLSAEKLVNLTVVYRPSPSKQNKLTTKMFLQDFESFLDERLTERDKTVVTGISTSTLFTLMLFFGLRTKTHMSPQLLLYPPIDVPVHGPTC